jgi:hypothetical protein
MLEETFLLSQRTSGWCKSATAFSVLLSISDRMENQILVDRSNGNPANPKVLTCRIFSVCQFSVNSNFNVFVTRQQKKTVNGYSVCAKKRMDVTPA